MNVYEADPQYLKGSTKSLVKKLHNFCLADKKLVDSSMYEILVILHVIHIDTECLHVNLAINYLLENDPQNITKNCSLPVRRDL